MAGMVISAVQLLSPERVRGLPMFETLFANPGAIVGTLLGFAVSIGLHYLLSPTSGDVLYLYAGVVVVGFIAGLIFDARSDSK
jgi:hypothetical protein